MPWLPFLGVYSDLAIARHKQQQANSTPNMPKQITFTSDTWVKASPDMSDQLPDTHRELFKKGSSISVQAIASEPENGHIYVTLDQKSKIPTVDGRNSVYLYLAHTDYKVPDLAAPSTPSSPQGYKMSQAGIDLVVHYEGYRDCAYLCSANVLTLGIGSTTWFGKPVTSGMTCTREEAEQQFREDIVRFEDGVKQHVTRDMTQGQFDAFVSFAYNCGVGAFAESTLLRKFNAGDEEAARCEMPRWTNGGLAGLVFRRDSEVHLFYTGEFKPFN